MFKLAPNGKPNVLHTFTSGSDGGNPDSVVLDGAGNLYCTAATEETDWRYCARATLCLW